MMILYSLVLLLLVSASQAQEKLKVSLYYESRCPYSISFVVQQLYPNYEALKSYLDVEFIPYGFARKTNVNGTWAFKCQHGEYECKGNAATLCAFQQTNNQDEQVEFVNCLESQNNPGSEQSIYKCTVQLGLDYDAMFFCLLSGKGYDLLAEYGDRFNSVKPKIKHVPWIIFNGKYDEALEKRATKNFLGVVCDLLNKKPDVCTK